MWLIRKFYSTFHHKDFLTYHLTGLDLGLHPANERRRYNVTPSLIGKPRISPYTPVTPAKPTRNRPRTDKNHQIRGEIGLQSVLIRFCRFGVGLCSGRQICRGEIFQICLKDLSLINCLLSVGYMSVWCRFCRGAFGDVSVLIRPPMVDGLSVLDRLCIGHMSDDLTPIQGRFKTESSAT